MFFYCLTMFYYHDGMENCNSLSRTHKNVKLAKHNLKYTLIKHASKNWCSEKGARYIFDILEISNSILNNDH